MAVGSDPNPAVSMWKSSVSNSASLTKLRELILDRSQANLKTRPAKESLCWRAFAEDLGTASSFPGVFSSHATGYDLRGPSFIFFILNFIISMLS